MDENIKHQKHQI